LHQHHHLLFCHLALLTFHPTFLVDSLFWVLSSLS
jgi:hypothetical protein